MARATTRPRGSTLDVVRCVAAACVALLAGGTVARSQEPSAPDASAAKWTLEGSVATSHTSNLYHLSESQRREFEAGADALGRFRGLESPSDRVTRLRLGAGLEKAWAEGRDVGVEIGAVYHDHQRNDASDFFAFDLAAGVDLTRADRFTARVGLVPDRFHKNYRSAWGNPFAPAEYRERVMAAGYERDLPRRTRLGLEYGFETRRYNEGFEDRGGTGHRLRATLEQDRGSRTTMRTGIGCGRVSAHSRPGVAVLDRSHDELTLDHDVLWRISRRWRMELEAGLALRRYTTDVQSDVDLRGETEMSTHARATVQRTIARNLALLLEVGRLTGDLAWDDLYGTEDDPGYEEWTGGLGIEYRF